MQRGILLCVMLLRPGLISLSSALPAAADHAWPQFKSRSGIVFPNANAVPSRPPKDNVKFLTAATAVHSAAKRLLSLSMDDDDDDNWAVSPLGLTAMMGQLMLGSKGEFHRVLGEIISPDGTERPDLGVHRELGDLLDFLQDEDWVGYLLYVNSALFLTPDIEVKQSFRHALNDFYNADVLITDFRQPTRSMDFVNMWADRTTYGHIAAILGEPLPAETRSFFVNTVYFRGGWKTPFDPQLTRPALFYTNPGTQVVSTFMAGDIEVLYYEDDIRNCSMVGIPYKNFEIIFYIFLPNQQSDGRQFRLREFADNLTLDHMSKMIALAQVENMTLAMPKLKINSKVSLRRPIVRAINKNKLSQRAMFNLSPGPVTEEDIQFQMLASNWPKPLPLKIDSPSDPYRNNFSMGSASDDVKFQVDDVIHDVEIEVNENGTEASAITSTIVDYTGVRFMNINRPFLFLIRQELTKTNLFWGTVRRPTS